MGKKTFILLLAGIFFGCGCTAYADDVPGLAMPADTQECTWSVHYGTEYHAILCHGTNVPNVQTIQINAHSSNTPIFHNHTLAKHESALRAQQRQQFVLQIAATTDAIPAHHYIYALRRILR